MIKNVLKSKILIPLLAITTAGGIITYNVVSNDNITLFQDNSEKNVIDSDGDTLSDYDEINIYKTDPQKKDTDDDGLDDNIEIELKTDPLNPDTDDDGLLDGKPQYKDNNIIAPTDPNPLNYNNQKGIWKKYIQEQLNSSIPSYLTKFYEYNKEDDELKSIEDIIWDDLLKSNNLKEDILNLPLLLEILSKTLTFRLDNGDKILHSQTKQDIYEYIMTEAQAKLPTDVYTNFKNTVESLNIEPTLETWQKKFGYNEIFDEVFKVATKGNMKSAQLFFENSNGKEHVLWLWQGDYLTLGSGAEMGLYKKKETSTETNRLNIEHWDAVDFDIPMTLSLYEYNNENDIKTIFNWNPVYPQWWITGFNPEIKEVDASKQIIIGTIDFSAHKDMYESLKEKNINNNEIKNNIIFDNKTLKVWICW